MPGPASPRRVSRRQGETQISTRGRYAVMATVDIASRGTEGRAARPVCLAKIAARQRLGQAYLEQLFGKPRRTGLVRSVRGPGGGYRLAPPPGAISVAEIVAAVDEPTKAARCTIGRGSRLVDAGTARANGRAPDAPAPIGPGGSEPTAGASSGPRCQTHDLWFELGRQIALFLSGITLSDVVLGHLAGRAVSLPAGVPHHQDAE